MNLQLAIFIISGLFTVLIAVIGWAVLRITRSLDEVVEWVKELAISFKGSEKDIETLKRDRDIINGRLNNHSERIDKIANNQAACKTCREALK